MTKGQSAVGRCPDCGAELKRTGHQAGEAKYRYQCSNRDCKNYLKKWFNRYGEHR